MACTLPRHSCSSSSCRWDTAAAQVKSGCNATCHPPWPTHLLYSSSVVSSTNGICACETSVRKPPPGLESGSANSGLRGRRGRWRAHGKLWGALRPGARAQGPTPCPSGWMWECWPAAGARRAGETPCSLPCVPAATHDSPGGRQTEPSARPACTCAPTFPWRARERCGTRGPS